MTNTAAVFGGPRTHSLKRDSEGHREFMATWLVKCSYSEGPYSALNAAGLPIIGSTWEFKDEVDTNAYCYPDADVKIHDEVEGQPANWYSVSLKFSTRPLKRCQDTPIEDPLMQPQDVSGGSVKYNEEAVRDRYGNFIRTSSFEPLRGQQVEFDANRHTVHIEQNVASLELDFCTSLLDHVNDSDLWGVSSRKVKLSNIQWKRLVRGSCNYYFQRIFDFDINPKGFDRDLLDSGTKVLRGKWSRVPGTSGGIYWELVPLNGKAPDPLNPQDFIRYKDVNGENAHVILNGAGLPAGVQVGTATGTGLSGPGTVHVEKYPEANFLLLGIPSDLES